MSVISVIYEDEYLVVVDKPAGMVSNRAATVKEQTLQDWWHDRYSVILSNLTKEHQTLSENKLYFVERLGLVHRLDKETSGVMVLAKSPETFTELLRQFKEREIKKEYLALTHGFWEPKTGEISLPIGRARHDRQMMSVREDGRESMTQYAVEKEWKNLCELEAKRLKVNRKGYSGFSLVRFAPKTGRMHQIRVHAKHMGHPLVGDQVYAGRKRSREDRKWCEGLMLSAVSIELFHPKRGRMKFESKEQRIGKYLSLLC